MADTLGLFNANWYLKHNPDVAQAVSEGVFSAYEHFQQFGKYEGRSYNSIFDESYYLSQNPDVAAAVDAGVLTAYDHFLTFGHNEGRSFVPFFDLDFYLGQHSDLSAVFGENPTAAISHFFAFGQNETRAIAPGVDLAAYLNANPDVAAAVEEGANALQHLLHHGFTEGRDLGNGVSLAQFVADPAFQNAVQSGDAIAAIARVAEVAPFLSTYKAPDNWTAPSNLPIPIDFIPPAGTSLVIPAGVNVPAGVILPDAFQSGTPSTDAESPGTAPGAGNSGSGGGKPGGGKPGGGKPGDGEPGDGEPGDGEPGDGEPGDGEPGDGEPGDGEPGDGEPGGTLDFAPQVLDSDGSKHIVFINTHEAIHIDSISQDAGLLTFNGTYLGDTWSINVDAETGINGIRNMNQDVYISPEAATELLDAGLTLSGEGIVVVKQSAAIGTFDISAITNEVSLQVRETIAGQTLTLRADQSGLISGAGDISIQPTETAATVVINSTGSNFIHAGFGGDTIHLPMNGGNDVIAVYGGVMTDDDLATISQARTDLSSFETVNGTLSEINANYLSALDIQSQRGTLNLDVETKSTELNTHRDAVGSDTAVTEALSNAQSALNDHLSKGSLDDLENERDTLSNQLNTRTLLEQELTEASNALEALGERTTVEDALSTAQLNYDTRENLKTAYNDAANAFAAHISTHGDETQITNTISAAEQAVTEREGLITAVGNANDSLEADLLKGADGALAQVLADATSLQLARTGLEEAVTTATSLLDAHTVDHGSDLDVDEAVTTTQNALDEHINDVTGGASTEDLELALQNAQLALADDPENPTLIQAVEDAQASLNDRQEFELAVNNAQGIQTDRNDLKQGVVNATDDLMNHTTAHGETSALDDAVNDATAAVNLRAQLRTDLADATQALTDARTLQSDDDLNQAVIQAQAVLTEYENLETASQTTGADLSAHITTHGEDGVLDEQLNTATLNLSNYEAAELRHTNALSDYNNHLELGDTAAFEQALADVLADIILRGTLESEFGTATTNADARQDLIDAYDLATVALNDHVNTLGDDEAVDTAVTQASNALTNHTLLTNALNTAIANGQASMSDSESFLVDSTPNTMDTIYNFQVGQDKLQLSTSTVAEDASGEINGISYTIDNGIVTTQANDSYQDVLLAMSEHLADSHATVAFYSASEMSTFILQGDGVQGLTESDTVIRLSGTTLTDLQDVLM